MASALVAGPGAAAPPESWRASVPPGAYVLDPSRARLTAKLRLLGVSRYPLRFTQVSGRLVHDGDATPRVSIRVDPRAVDRPGDLPARQAVSLLQPERYPSISFTGRELRSDGEQETLTGDLTLHGVTRPVQLDVELRTVRSDGGRPAARVAFTGSAQIRRSDFGMPAMRSVVGDRVDLVFDVEFVRH